MRDRERRKNSGTMIVKEREGERKKEENGRKKEKGS